LEVLDQLAGEVPGEPLDGESPDHVGDVAEERDDEVGSGQVPDEHVDRRGAELAAQLGRSGTVDVTATPATPATNDADQHGTVSGHLRRSMSQDWMSICPYWRFVSEDWICLCLVAGALLGTRNILFLHDIVTLANDLYTYRYRAKRAQNLSKLFSGTG